MFAGNRSGYSEARLGRVTKTGKVPPLRAAGPATNLAPDSSANLPCDPHLKGGTRREYCRSKKSATTTEKSQSQQNIMDTREESTSIAADSRPCPRWPGITVHFGWNTLENPNLRVSAGLANRIVAFSSIETTQSGLVSACR